MNNRLLLLSLTLLLVLQVGVYDSLIVKRLGTRTKKEALVLKVSGEREGHVDEWLRKRGDSTCEVEFCWMYIRLGQ